MRHMAIGLLIFTLGGCVGQPYKAPRSHDEAITWVREDERRVARLERRRVSELLRMGGRDYDRGRYSSAEAAASRALSLDPKNAYARHLLDDARRARHHVTVRGNRARHTEQWKRAMEDIDASKIPQR